MNTKQPKALLLSDEFNEDQWIAGTKQWCAEAASELRRLHEENQALRIDAECFRYWVREAACSPGDMAKLIAHCVTEQDYRDAIMPIIQHARAAIAQYKGDQA